ncbi:hypothetical protein D554_0288, partial [Bordetella holmesii 30539]
GGRASFVEKPSGRGRHIYSEATMARAAPDGYTLVLGVTGSHGINTLALQEYAL